MPRFVLRRVATLVTGLVVCSAFASVASAAPQASWRVAARANDSSEYFAAASIFTNVKGALAARLTVSASATVKVKGDVFCTKSFSLESRSFAFSLRNGTRAVPLPLRGADCTYSINASLANAGRVAVALSVYK